MESLENFEDFARQRCQDSENSWLTQSLATYLKGSPVSKVLTWHYFNWCLGKSRAACFEKDLELAQVVSTKGDFAEGVRALLIDKDKSPTWKDQSIGLCEERLKEDLNKLFN
jgi:hypothetical protein